MNNESYISSNNCNTGCASRAEQLNLNFFCATLNREQLNQILLADDINHDILISHPQLFSNTTVFISPTQYQQMQDIIEAISRTVNLPGYIQKILTRAPAIASINSENSGVFMGYDFHLSQQGPKVIEINTNAGGAFLNAALVSAQSECCRAAGKPLPQFKIILDKEFMAMFLREWKLERDDKTLRCIAIVDKNPSEQFLYPEFKIAQRIFERNGIDAIIVDADELQFNNNQLTYHGQVIDLVYNRLTDFYFSSTPILRKAYEGGAVVVTPNPQQYALYADKRNLTILSNSEELTHLGVAVKDIEILIAGVPQTQLVTAENADQLWKLRRQLFFKPASGFGSRAAYRGDKLTKRVWEEILQGDYVAQQIVLPGERGITLDGEQTTLKADIRAYVYNAEIQLLAARLYQGQTTNFRTQGGGFAPVLVA